MTVIRIRSWEEFKTLVLKHKPGTVFYLGQPHLFGKPPLGLRLTFYHGQDMYVMTDYAKGTCLVKTGIPITNPEDKVQAQVRDSDIRDFLSQSFPWIEPVSLPPFMYGQFM
jgi:hypothetical protein